MVRLRKGWIFVPRGTKQEKGNEKEKSLWANLFPHSAGQRRDQNGEKPYECRASCRRSDSFIAVVRKHQSGRICEYIYRDDCSSQPHTRNLSSFILPTSCWN